MYELVVAVGDVYDLMFVVPLYGLDDEELLLEFCAILYTTQIIPTTITINQNTPEPSELEVEVVAFFVVAAIICRIVSTFIL